MLHDRGSQDRGCRRGRQRRNVDEFGRSAKPANFSQSDERFAGKDRRQDAATQPPRALFLSVVEIVLDESGEPPPAK
jgi:hypothetical protein